MISFVYGVQKVANDVVDVLIAVFFCKQELVKLVRIVLASQ